MKKTILVQLLLAVTILSLNAQKAVLSGIVNDNDKKPLPGAYILLPEIKMATATDINGYYIIKNIPAGSYTVNVSFIGCKPVSNRVILSEGAQEVADFTLNTGVDLNEVVISERLVGESKALNSQRSSLSITNIVSFEQIERFPDANIGDALKRLTGISMMYDQGEARFGVIRGTQPELNSVTINGERIPSAEAEKRYVQLDLVPSDMIQTIEVNKALTPDMDADAIGGSINLITKTASSGPVLSGTIGSGYNFISGKFPVKGNITFSNRFANDKLGLVIDASVFNNPMESHDIEAEWDYSDENNKDATAYLTNFEVRQYFVTRLRQNYSLSTDYEFDKNNRIFISGIYNWRNDYENRYRLRVKDIEPDNEDIYTGEIIRQLKAGSSDTRNARLEDQRMMNFRLGGRHLIGKMNIDWSSAWSRASEERPKERYLGFNAEDVLLTIPDLQANLREPIVVPEVSYSDFNNNYGIDELTEEYQLTKETDLNFSLNAEVPLLSGKLKSGVRYRGKNKIRENDFYEYSPVDEDLFLANSLAAGKDFSDDRFKAGNYSIGTFPLNEFIGNAELSSGSFDREQVIEELAGNFTASEKLISGYAMYSGWINTRFSYLAGVRIENSVLNYSGYQYFIDENDPREEWLEKTDAVEDNYINILPGIHFKYSPNNNMNFRLAWTNTIARPNYFDLVPYREVNADDSELAIGNPDLKPTNAMNFDLLAEYYFSNIGIISGGLFYKKLDNVVAMTIDDDYQYYYNGTVSSWKLLQPRNVGNGILMGIEGTFSRRLTFLPSFLSNLSFYTNYTYNFSKLTDVTVEGREEENLQIPGSPRHLINLSLAYDTKLFDIRLAYNHASVFRDGTEGGYGEEAFYDRWYDKVDYLDLNANFVLSRSFKIYFEINNILNQPLRYYQGVSDRTMQAEYYGLRIKSGLKFNF
jgi:TonB-dependent receptor